jgi:membrane fusion protein (multidrug efflux system)
MFARAQIVEGVNANALTVPQRTITRGAGGAASVLVVTDDNKVEVRNIETGRTAGHKVIVTKGLKAGERIIVEGSQKAPPGSAVKPVPFNPAAHSRPPANSH